MIELDAQQSTVPYTPMAPHYISLAYLIYDEVLPITYMLESVEVVAFHFNLQYPIK